MKMQDWNARLQAHTIRISGRMGIFRFIILCSAIITWLLPGKCTWYIAAVILGREFTYRKLVWDNDLIAQMIAMEKNFWESHVVPRVLPSPDGSDICNEVLNEYFHAARKGSSIRLEGFEDKLRRRAEIMEQIERLKQEQGA